MRHFFIILSVISILLISIIPARAESENEEKKTERLQIGGYGEAVATYNFFSDRYMRYSDAETYRNASGHGRVDIPPPLSVIR